MSGSDFRDLEVWKKARELALVVYKLTTDGPLARDFGLRDQMRRSAVSICSNIAEGNERNTDRDTVRFLYMMFSLVPRATSVAPGVFEFPRARSLAPSA